MKSFKTSFLLHDDSLEILEELSDEECGKLFKAISKAHKAIVSEKTQWVNSDKLGLSRLEWVLFKPFYNQLLRDYDKYMITVNANKENGKKGGRPKSKKPNGLNGNPKNPDKDNDSVNDNGSDSVNDNETYIVDESELLAEKTIDFLNSLTKKSFGYGVGNKKEIKAQIVKLKNQGNTLKEIEDKFAYVIRVKTDEWINNAEMKKHLNPVTLFRECNFDKYLNQDMKMSQDDLIDAVFDEIERRA